MRIKFLTGADLYAALTVAAAVIVIWGGIFYVLVKDFSDMSVAGVPNGLKPFYGDPTTAMAFVRLKIE